MKTKKNLLNTTVTLTNDFDDESNENFDIVNNEIDETYGMSVCPKCGKVHMSDEGDYCLYCGKKIIEEEFVEPISIKDKVVAYYEGDNAYFNDIWKEGMKMALYKAKEIVGNEDSANDIAFEVMLNWYEHPEYLSIPEAFCGWVRTCARNKALTMVKSTAYKNTTSLDAMNYGKDDDLMFEPEDTRDTSNPETVLFKNDEYECFYNALNSLKKEERDVLIGVNIKGATLAEYAEEAGLKFSTVQGRYQQGKMHLKSEIVAIRNKDGMKRY